MRKTMMTVLSACAAAVVQAAGPIDTVEMTTGTADGKSETRMVKLTAQPDGAWRFRLRTIDMRPEWKTVKVVNLAGKSRTGDPGWWLTNDERWGAFTRTDGKKVQSPMRIVLFGGKTAEDEAWCGIVKGMRYECTETVEAKGGAYELPERKRAFWANVGAQLKPADRDELELLLPSKTPVLISEM